MKCLENRYTIVDASSRHGELHRLMFSLVGHECRSAGGPENEERTSDTIWPSRREGPDRRRRGRGDRRAVPPVAIRAGTITPTRAIVDGETTIATGTVFALTNPTNRSVM